MEQKVFEEVGELKIKLGNFVFDKVAVEYVVAAFWPNDLKRVFVIRYYLKDGGAITNFVNPDKSIWRVDTIDDVLKIPFGKILIQRNGETIETD